MPSTPPDRTCQIENGRVVADVEVENLDVRFINARMLARVPVGERQAILVPAAAVTNVSGLDMVTVATKGGPIRRLVLLGEHSKGPHGQVVEIISGLRAGDLVWPDAAAAPASQPGLEPAPKAAPEGIHV